MEDKTNLSNMYLYKAKLPLNYEQAFVYSRSRIEINNNW
jgi:hypothetical protein